MPQAKTTSANLYITCGDSSAPNYWRCSVSGCLNDPRAVSSILAEVAYFLYFTYRRKITFFLQKFIRQVQNCPSCEFWAVSTCQRLKIKHYDFWISRRKKFSVKKFGNLKKCPLKVLLELRFGTPPKNSENRPQSVKKTLQIDLKVPEKLRKSTSSFFGKFSPQIWRRFYLDLAH